jgi:hypothetical protein
MEGTETLICLHLIRDAEIVDDKGVLACFAVVEDILATSSGGYVVSIVRSVVIASVGELRQRDLCRDRSRHPVGQAVARCGDGEVVLCGTWLGGFRDLARWMVSGQGWLTCDPLSTVSAVFLPTLAGNTFREWVAKQPNT